MRTDKFLINVSISIFIFLIFGVGCNGINPIIVDPNAVGVSQTGFVSRISAIYNPDDQRVWLCVPRGFTAPSSKITVSVPDELALTFLTQPDGGFMYRFVGDLNWSATITWTDPNHVSHKDNVTVTNPGNSLDEKVIPAGLYPNRLGKFLDDVTVVNSGDDEIAPFDPNTLEFSSSRIELPQFSNPWEFSVNTSGIGLVTTLFGGVYSFDASSGSIYPVSSDGFSDFSSPNGVAISPSDQTRAWVTNANPISYFPTEFGPGWVSCIELDGHNGSVTNEIPTDWYNPQYVITDGDFVYVSCSGTIDFVPPDYVATALDNGGVHVIDARTNTIVESYDLGKGGPGPMAITPSGKFLYIGSGVAGWLYKIDLENGIVLNDASNPIVIDDYDGTFVPFIEIDKSGLLATASFNTDTLYFMDSETGEQNPFPFFGPVKLHPDDETAFYGPQDALFINRNGRRGLVLLTSVVSSLHWLPL